MCRQGVLFVVAICLVVFVQTFDVKTFCKTRCAVGRGGNLCRCNAFHFAGKRSDGQYKRQEFDSIDTDNNNDLFQSYLLNLPRSLPVQRHSVQQQNDYDDNDVTTRDQMLYPVSGEALFRRAVSGQMDSDYELLPGDVRNPDSNTRSQKEGNRLQNLLQKQYKRYKNNNNSNNNKNNNNNSNKLSGVLPIGVNDFYDRSGRSRNTLHHTDKAGRR